MKPFHSSGEEVTQYTEDIYEYVTIDHEKVTLWGDRVSLCHIYHAL